MGVGTFDEDAPEAFTGQLRAMVEAAADRIMDMHKTRDTLVAVIACDAVLPSTVAALREVVRLDGPLRPSRSIAPTETPGESRRRKRAYGPRAGRRTGGAAGTGARSGPMMGECRPPPCASAGGRAQIGR